MATLVRAGVGVGVGTVSERPGELRKITMPKKNTEKNRKIGWHNNKLPSS